MLDYCASSVNCTTYIGSREKKVRCRFSASTTSMTKRHCGQNEEWIQVKMVTKMVKQFLEKSSLFSCVYSRVKLFVFAMSSRRRYYIFVGFIYGLEEKNWKSEVVFAVCRLPLTSCLTSLFISLQCRESRPVARLSLSLLCLSCKYDCCVLFWRL